MRKSIAAGNWKMNKTTSQGVDFLTQFNKESLPDDVDIIIAAPFTHLDAMNKHKGAVDIAAQNCFWKSSGAYTGEVSLEMLADIGIKTVILGHSERREIFSESDELIQKKVDACLAEEVQVIWCCGEPLDVRQSDSANAYVLGQLMANLFHLHKDDIKKVIIAYEPIWAIGTGETATPAQAQEMHAFIRMAVADQYDQETADAIPILYGGSVKPANATEIFSQPDVDGGLVGGASLDLASFLAIANSF